MAWKIASEKDFFDYLDRLRKSKTPGAAERADALEMEHLKWAKAGYGPEDAVRKAFASVDMDQAAERLKPLRGKEEKLLKKTGWTKKDEELAAEIAHWKHVKGSTLTQHQKGQKFFRHSKDEEIITPKPPGRTGRSEGKGRPQSGPGFNDAEFGRRAREASEEAERDRREEAPEIIKLAIESQPMLQVPIRIYRMLRRQHRQLQRDDFEHYLTLTLRPNVVRNVMVVFDDFRHQNFGPSPARKREAREWLELRRLPQEIITILIDDEFPPERENLINENRRNTLEGSGRWRERGDYLRPIGENYRTALYIDLPRGKYVIEVDQSLHSRFYHGEPKDGDYNFVEWQVYFPGQREPETFDRNKIEIYLTGPTRMIACYEKKGIKHTKQPGVRSPYQEGPGGVFAGGPHGRGAAAGDSAFAALSAKGIRERLGRNVETRQRKTDPYLLAAENKGKRILNGYASAEYSRVFDPLRTEYRRRATELRNLERAARTARGQLRRLLRQRVGVMRTAMRRTNEDAINMADEATRGGATPADAALIEARDTLRRYLDARDKYYEDFKRDMESASAHLRDYLVNKAGTVATGLARRYKMPLNSPAEDELDKTLKEYAANVAEDFITRGRTMGHAILRGMGIASRGTETFGAAGMNVLGSTVDLIFGPWTWTIAFTLLQFFFVFNFVGYNVTYLWIFPLIGAAFTFMMNFSDSVKPLDWLTHMASGAIIGYSTILLLLSLGALGWSFMTPIILWIIWGVLGFLGVMQFYQTGGYRVVLQGGVIILVFSYVALGPYSAYYQQTIDQVKAPIEIAYRAVDKAVTDVWLLATDPTEFYARQQVVNVKPETPIDFAKGVEVTLLDALPAAVPSGQEFAITAVVKNDGTLMDPARDVCIDFACKQWCNAPAKADPLATTYKLCIESGTFVENYYCAVDCGRDTAMPGQFTLNECINSCGGQDNVGFAGGSSSEIIEYCRNPLSTGFVGGGGFFGGSGASSSWEQECSGAVPSGGKFRICSTRGADQVCHVYIPKLEKGEASALNQRGFNAFSQARRSGETRIATVLMNVSYRYSTASSLLTEVMSEDEINRRVQEKENVFRNVPATAKMSPARLSLNVGPQPLISGNRGALLLVSVSSTRDDGDVVLPAGTAIRITMPKSVGSNLDCAGGQRVSNTDAQEVVIYRVQRDITVLSTEFNSIFAFLCNFDVTEVSEVKSDLITADIPDYKFVLKKKKDISVTHSLGITFDPNEKYCQLCGVGATDVCTAGECFGLSRIEYTCWYEHATGTETVREFTPGVDSSCHSCGIAKSCEYFLPSDCKSPGDPDYEGSGAGRCGYSCWFDETAGQSGTLVQNPSFDSSTLSTEGLCREKILTGISVGTCSTVPFVTSYNKYKDYIATAVQMFPLDNVQNPEALVAALISRESSWNERAFRNEPEIGDASYGLMQIVPKFHPECDLTKIRDYDVAENIKCGVRFLGKNIMECGSIEGALTKYNSGSCSGTTYDPNYVNQIMNGDANFKASYNNWAACAQVAKTCLECVSAGNRWCANPAPLTDPGVCVYSPQISCPEAYQTLKTIC